MAWRHTVSNFMPAVQWTDHYILNAARSHLGLYLSDPLYHLTLCCGPIQQYECFRTTPAEVLP
jgi:hypothetical protein